jgi:hypothetical protein
MSHIVRHQYAADLKRRRRDQEVSIADQLAPEVGVQLGCPHDDRVSQRQDFAHATKALKVHQLSCGPFGLEASAGFRSASSAKN